MNKKFFSLLMAFSFLVIFFSNETRAQEISAKGEPDSFVIGNLKRVHKTYGCDCKLQTPEESRKNVLNKFVFQSDAGGTPAWMNIAGKDVQLKLVYASPPTKGGAIGSRYYKRFVGKGISVLIRYIVNAICPEENPECDEEGHKATITVTRGGHKQTIKAIGMCGWC